MSLLPPAPAALVEFELQLLDRGQHACANTAYRADVGGRALAGTSDAEGIVRLRLAPGKQPLHLEYVTAEDEKVALDLVISPGSSYETDEEYVLRIRSLGYGAPDDEAHVVVLRFQHAQHLRATGALDDATRTAVREFETKP